MTSLNSHPEDSTFEVTYVTPECIWVAGMCDGDGSITVLHDAKAG